MDRGMSKTLGLRSIGNKTATAFTRTEKRNSSMGKQRARVAYQRNKEPIQSPLHQIERRAEMDCRAQDLVERGMSALCSARWRSSSREQQHGLRIMARRMAAELEAQRTKAELE
jgi:hypothetical protein